MDQLWQKFEKLREDIVQGFEQQCELFGDQVREQLGPLVERAAKVEILESENKRLRSSLERVTQVRIENSTQGLASTACLSGLPLRDVSLQDSGEFTNSLQYALNRKNREIVRLTEAHTQVIAKARKLKKELLAERKRTLHYKKLRMGTSQLTGPEAIRTRSSSDDPLGSDKITSKAPEEASKSFPGPSALSNGESEQIKKLSQRGHLGSGKVAPAPSCSYEVGYSLECGEHRYSNGDSEDIPTDSTQSVLHSETCQDEIVSDMPSPQSDVPVVISERCIQNKRRRSLSTDTRHVHIKLEHTSENESSFSHTQRGHRKLVETHGFSTKPQIPNSSMDLDDVIAPQISTFASVGEACAYNIVEGQAGASSDPSTNMQICGASKHLHKTFVASLGDSGCAIDTEGDVSSERLVEYTRNQNRRANKPECPESGGTNTKFRDQNVLQPKTPNPRVLPPLANKFSTLGKKSREVRPEMIHALTEDRDSCDPLTVMKGTSKGHRLNALLWRPVKAIDTPAHVKLGNGVERHTGDLQPPALSKLSPKPNRTLQSRGFLNDSPTTVYPFTTCGIQTTRLRDTHQSQLEPQDFVLNCPKNQGIDFAYSDVVRKRSERACLPNCTKPECCGGKFAQFASLSRYRPSPRSKLTTELAGASRNYDDLLIMEYLGCVPELLDSMCKDEREKNLKAAISWQFGQEHGRHRNAHQRPASPPGFWRTEMPSTQEVEDDRKAAVDLRKRIVEERLREAMNPRGRWSFRDEVWASPELSK